jgi:hypothetical protein
MLSFSWLALLVRSDDDRIDADVGFAPVRPTHIPTERTVLWAAIVVLCGIAVAVSIRRLIALADPVSAAEASSAPIEALFAANPGLTRGHVVAGLLLALLLPIQLSARVRGRFPRVHRWLGRFLMVSGMIAGLTGYAMVTRPIGGWLEASAIVFFGTAFLTALVKAWIHIRQGDVLRHREWVLRAVAIALGIATTRPVVAAFFATSSLTGLSPSQFFGAAFWIGFTSTALAGEWYIRVTRLQGPGA